MNRTENFEYNGYNATILIPENPNGKWLWKTEFFYAFDQAEQALLQKGYSRVYYQISDKYGSDNAVKLMREFHKEILKKFYFLEEKPILFGFSRGGLYAFNYALRYPDCVKKVYFDAPVLNLKSWPKDGSTEQEQFFQEYGLNKESFADFNRSPIDRLDEYFSAHIPTLIIAGDSDYVVPFSDNGAIMCERAKELKADVKLIIKKGCGHHPHSLEDVAPIIEFIEKQ